MTFMAFLLMIIFFLAFFIYCTWLNPADITLFYWVDHGITFSPALLIVGFILIGLIIGYGAHIYSLFTHGFKNWKYERLDKKAREVSTIYREGVGRLLSGDLKKARVLLQKALDRDPKRVETYIALASLNSQEGESAAGLDQLRKARDLDPKSLEVLFKMANLQEEMGQDDDAAETYREIIKREKDNRKALRALRDLHTRHNRWQEALDTQRQVLKAGPGSNRIQAEKETLQHLRYETARLSINEGDAEQAKSDLKDIARQMTSFVPAKVTLGDAYAALGQNDEAVKTWQNGFKALGESVFLTRLEDHFMGKEDPSSLLSFYRAMVIERSDDLLLKLFYAKLCLRLEMVDEALDQLQQIESSGVESSQVHVLFAEAHRRRQRTDDAIADYQKALGITNKIQLKYVCESCGTGALAWESRCPNCEQWGTYSLADHKQIKAARPLEAIVIHHGERTE